MPDRVSQQAPRMAVKPVGLHPAHRKPAASGSLATGSKLSGRSGSAAIRRDGECKLERDAANGEIANRTLHAEVMVAASGNHRL